MQRQQDIQRILEEFKGVRNIPGDQNSKEESTHHKNKITTEELQNAICKLKKKANPQTAMEFVPKTSKLATTRREKW